MSPSIKTFEDIWQEKKVPSFEDLWKSSDMPVGLIQPTEPAPIKQFKDFALTREGSAQIVARSPELAKEFAAKEQPSRADLKKLGITGWNAEERNQLSYLFRDGMMETGITDEAVSAMSQELATQEPQDPDAAGFWESLAEEYETPTKAIQTTVPVVSEMLKVMESAPAREAMSRLSKGWDYSEWVIRPHAGSRMTGFERFPGWKATREGDRKRVEDFFNKQAEMIERQERGYTFGGQAAKGISALPKYMGEFAMTGGFASLGQKAGQRAVLRIFGGRVPQGVMKQIWRASGWSARALARSATGFSPKIAANAIERHMPKQVHFDDQGKLVIDVAGETTAMSILKAWGEVTIESAGEETGNAIVGMLPFGRTFTKKLGELYIAKFGGKIDDVFLKMIKKGGYSSFIGELGEEDVTRLMHYATGIQGEGDLKQRVGQALKEMLTSKKVDAAVLITPLATRGAVGVGAKMVKDVRELGEPEPIRKIPPISEAIQPVQPQVEPPPPPVEGKVTKKEEIVAPAEAEAVLAPEDQPKAIEAIKTFIHSEDPAVAKLSEEQKLKVGVEILARRGVTVKPEDLATEAVKPEAEPAEPTKKFEPQEKPPVTKHTEEEIAAAKPAEKVEEKPDVEITKEEAIIEPATSLEMEQRKTGEPVSKGTGQLDPTKADEALEITKLHAKWLEGNKLPVFDGIYSQKWDKEKRENVKDVIEYTREEVDEAYRTVQKSIPSPMTDTKLFAMPGKESELEAIGKKMAKLSKLARKKIGRKGLTKAKNLPKAVKTKEDNIKAVYQASTREATRYAIDGLLVEGDTIIAIDGRRMFWLKGKWGKDGLYLNAASLKKGKLGKVYKKGEKKFPKWQDIVPDISDQQPILVNTEATWSDARRAALLTSEESRGIVIVLNKDGSLGFAGAAPEVGHAEINVQPGGKILGGVNPDFFLDMLAFHAKRGDASFEFYSIGPERPMLSRSLDGKTFTLTMPVSLGGEAPKAVLEAIAEFRPAEEKPKSKGLKKKPAVKVKPEEEVEKPKKKGLKEKPSKPAEPEAKAEEEGGGVAWQTAVRQALEKSQKERRVVRVEQKKERRRRAGAYEGTVKWLVEDQGLSSKEALKKATAMLKGPLTEYQLYEGLEKFLPQETIDNAYDDIRTTDKLRPYERIVTEIAFEKLEDGVVLTPYDVKIIKKWRPEFAKIAEQRVPTTVWIFSNIEQALGLLKFGAAFDIQTRRQARWLRARHPKLYAQAVGKNIGAYISKKYAEKLAREVEDDPRHEDAVAHGVKFLKHEGERPEQFISSWGEKVPLGIGKAYAASMRGFIDSLNWLQQQLWNYKVEHWERQGKTITEEDLYYLADFNNTFLGLAQAKTNFGRATRRVLAPVMWSPSLTWSRVRTPSMILTNKTMRIETAVSLASFIGSGMIYLLAASFLFRALDLEDPIEWDPRSSDFGKIRLGDTRIDVFGDGGPYIRALAQLIFAKKKNQAGRLRRRPRLEVLKQFIRNKRAPFFDFIGKVWSGRTYYGGPAWEIPDWAKIKEEGGLKQLVARAGEKITEPKIGQIGFLIAREVAEKFTPFFVQGAVEASWHDGWPIGLAAGTDEFFSGQTLSYKPSTFGELQMIQDISAVAKYDELWDDLSPTQQKTLRVLVPEINEYEELLAREKLPLERIDLREQNKVAERIRRSLPDDIKRELAPMGYRIIPGLSRRLGEFWLNDERYAKYEKLAGIQIEKRLRKLFADKSWGNLDITLQEKLVKKQINYAKKEARAKLVGRK